MPKCILRLQSSRRIGAARRCAPCAGRARSSLFSIRRLDAARSCSATLRFHADAVAKISGVTGRTDQRLQPMPLDLHGWHQLASGQHHIAPTTIVSLRVDVASHGVSSAGLVVDPGFGRHRHALGWEGPPDSGWRGRPPSTLVSSVGIAAIVEVGHIVPRRRRRLSHSRPDHPFTPSSPWTLGVRSCPRRHPHPRSACKSRRAASAHDPSPLYAPHNA